MYGAPCVRRSPADGPALVDVVTDPDALAIPPRTTAEQVSGFALSAGRAVLDGVR